MISRIALVVLLATPAYADDAADLARQANESMHELRYEEALKLVDRAWRSGHAGPDELRTLFATAGQAAAATGDENAARLWFSRWLCLDPQAQLPEGTSPKLTASFAQARDALGGRSLTARATRSRTAITLAITDPLSLVAAARVDGERIVVEEAKATLSHDAQDIALLDRHGNVLANVAIGDEVVEEPVVETPVVRKRSLLARGSTWALVSGGLALVGGGAIWVALDARSSIRDLNADSGNHQFSEAQSLQSRFEGAQWVARFALGAGAAAAVVGAVLWRRNEQVIVAPATGGGAVSWVLQF